MARIRNIARLPGDIRAQSNSRLHEALGGKSIQVWLNGLHRVQEVLAQSFDHRPVIEQNLSGRHRHPRNWPGSCIIVHNRVIFIDRDWNCGSRQADKVSGKANRPCASIISEVLELPPNG
jgi:hypothetical protein